MKLDSVRAHSSAAVKMGKKRIVNCSENRERKDPGLSFSWSKSSKSDGLRWCRWLFFPPSPRIRGARQKAQNKKYVHLYKMLRVREREGKKSKLGRAVMKIKESRYWNGLSLIKRRVNKFLGKRGRRRRRKKRRQHRSGGRRKTRPIWRARATSVDLVIGRQKVFFSPTCQSRSFFFPFFFQKAALQVDFLLTGTPFNESSITICLHVKRRESLCCGNTFSKKETGKKKKKKKRESKSNGGFQVTIYPATW